MQTYGMNILLVYKPILPPLSDKLIVNHHLLYQPVNKADEAFLFTRSGKAEEINPPGGSCIENSSAKHAIVYNRS